MRRAALLVAIGALCAGAVADARPRKGKATKSAKKGAKAKAPTPEPIAEPAPEPAPVVAPEPVAAPAPAPVAVRAGKPRVAVIGDATLAPSVAKALEGRFELVTAESGEPKALAAKHALAAVVVVAAGATSTAIAYDASGSELARAEIKGGKFVAAKKLPAEAADKLSPKIASAAPASEPIAASTEPAPATATASTEHGVTASVRATPRPRRDLVIAVEERPFWRRLRYNDDIDDRLRPSDLVANAVGITAAYRPVKGFQPFSVIGRGELAVGVNGSRTSDGTAYGTSSSEWGLGVALDAGIRSARVGLAVTYGEQRFAIDDDPTMELVPDVTYRFARGGVSFAMPLAPRLSLLATGGYRYLLGTGGLTGATWFPHATGAGIDLSAGIAYHVTSWLDLHARLDARRYFFAMNPEVGDPWIAGGATDDYIGGAIGLAISPR